MERRGNRNREREKEEEGETYRGTESMAKRESEKITR